MNSQFEMEGEEQVRRKIANMAYNSAQAYGEAVSWLNQKDRERAQRVQAAHARANVAHLLAERQTQSAETSVQLSQQQIQMTESAIRFAEKANKLSKLAILVGVIGCFLALAALLK